MSLSRLLLLMVAMPWLLAQEGSKQESPETAVAGSAVRGVELLRKGLYEESVRELDIAAKASDEPAVHWNLALALWQSGDAERAEAVLEKAAALANGRYDGKRDALLAALRLERAFELHAQQNARDALDVAKSAIEYGQRALGKPEVEGANTLNLARAIRLVHEIEASQQESEDGEGDGDESEGDESDGDEGQGEQGDQQDGSEEGQGEQESGDSSSQQEDQGQQDDSSEQNAPQDENSEPGSQERQGSDPAKSEQTDPSERGESQRSEPERGDEPDTSEGSQDRAAAAPESDDQEKSEAQRPEQQPAPSEASPGRDENVAAEADESEDAQGSDGSLRNVPSLSKQQQRSILDTLKRFEQQRRDLMERRKRSRPKVKRDW